MAKKKSIMKTFQVMEEERAQIYNPVPVLGINTPVLTFQNPEIISKFEKKMKK